MTSSPPGFVSKAELGSETVIASSQDLVDSGMAIRFERTINGRMMRCFAIRFQGQVHAWHNVCPHRSTELDWQPGEVFDASGLYLVCATHGAIFEPDTGLCVAGPCRGAMLERVTVYEEAGAITIVE